MSFEYVLENSGKAKKLSDTQKAEVSASVVSKFQDWDTVRQTQIDICNKLKPEIYLEDRGVKKTWKSQKSMNKIYSLFQTRQAFLWENIYADPSKMFDVEGKTPETQDSARFQKAALMDAFDKMKLSQQLDKSVEWLDSVGELCLFTSWKKKYKKIRRKIDISELGLEMVKEETTTAIYDQLIYDGAYVEAINPINLVFDPASTPEIRDEWDASGKIVKSWLTYDQIAGNEIYKLTKEELTELKNTIGGKTNDDEMKDAVDIRDDVFDNNRVEVLEYWGDFYFDGQTLKNYCIAVVARKYLARFMENPFIINPIINVAPTRHPDSKRGIPNLYSILDLALIQESDINETKDTQQLNKNPAKFAPKGFFDDEITEIEPGKVIEYRVGVDDPSAIIPINVPLKDAGEQIQYLDKAISDVSGVFPNMQGQVENGDTTATEIKVKVAGQTTRLSKDLDTIKQNGIVRIVENVAELLANEKNGVEEKIFMEDKGEKIFQVINDAIRQGEYDYVYSDSTALAVKKSQFQEALQLFNLAFQDPQMAMLLNKKEILTSGLEMIGLDNINKFFLANEQGQLINIITQSPEVAQMIMGIVPQIMQQITPPQPQGVENGQAVA